jgi:histidinol-phosphate aminotransferase
MVPVYLRRNRLRGMPIRLGPGGRVDVEQVVAVAHRESTGEAAVIYLCSPNNPTGGVIPDAGIRHIVENAPGIVILDAAYAEFAGGEDWTVRAVSTGRLIVLRTFSKAWGLAGLRIGYAVGPAALIEPMRAGRGPFSLNAVAERIATTALAQDRGWMCDHARRAGANRDRLVESLRVLGLSPLPSSANFVLVPVRDAARVAAGLVERGIAVRAFRDLEGIGDAVRIGVGPWELLDRCLAALREIRACG